MNIWGIGALVVAIAVAAGLGAALMVKRRELAHTRNKLGRQQSLLDMAGRKARFGAWSVDRRSGHVEMTDEVAAIQEIEPGDAFDLESAIKRYAPEYRNAVRAAVGRCLDHGEPFDEEWEIVAERSGRRVWIRSIGEPILDDDGNIVGAQGAFQDIDGRKRAEQSAELTRERFRQLANAMPMLVWTTTRDGAMDFLNQYGLEFVGATLEEVVGEKWLERLHPDDREPTVRRWMRAVENGEEYATEFRLRRHDGEYRMHRASAKPIRDEHGRIERWFGACLDVEEQHRLSQRLERTLESITDAFYAFDHDWRFIYVNAEGERQAGDRRESMLGRNVWEIYPAAKQTLHYSEYHRAVERGQPVHFVDYYEPLDMWLEVSAYPTDYGLAVYQRDVTNQKRIEERSRQAQRLESIGQLTGGIAHDFNNMLTVIAGNTELILEQYPHDEQLVGLAEIIQNAARRGADLTSRLLAFARRQPLEPGPVDLNRLTGQIEKMLGRTLGEHVELEVVRSPGLWPAMIDPGQLEDALLNLCINARDAMPDGGQLTIETFNARIDEDYADRQLEVDPGQYVGVAVTDTGEGIEPEVLSRIFEPFFTTKEKGRGTGLGLAMVYGFVKQSGGHVTVYSEPGEGTTVRLYLPRAEGSAADPGYPPAPAHRDGRETVLLVEDDELVRQVAARQLSTLGYTVLEADSGDDALQQLEEHAPIDLLFTDVVMPGNMSGKALAERAVEKYPGLKVLFTSGYTENAIVHHGRLDANVRLLSKPYTREQLARAIRRTLDQDQSPGE